MSHRAVRVWSFVHKWSSLVCTLFMLLLCITGLPLIFHHEIQHAQMPELAEVQPGTPAPGLDSIIASARAARPGEVVPYAYFDDEDPLVMVASGRSMAAPPDELFYQFYDLRSGQHLDVAQPTEGFMYIMLRLHMDMFAGLPGMLFLGVMGLLLVVAIVSGVVLYAPFMRKLDFATVRRQRGTRTRWLDLHNLLGIVTLVWLTVVGVTGSINTLAMPIERMWQASELVEMAASHRDLPPPTQLAPAASAIAAAERAMPDMKVRTVAFPGSPFASPHHYGIYLVGDSPLTSRLLTPALADAATGEITAMREMPLYAKTLFVSQPLHFGDYGGLPLKIVWALLDVASIVVLGSGLYLWLARRKAPAEKRLEEQDESTLATENNA
ncbi:PepSY-associated TM helix domain-containing protein [Pseudomonas schmalbachii]|uniref:PepSY domain-containing protein n=1 Tax=Pseudomonas schmalbachii TaxID=2816993 RepID=A0ABS3TP43_9PSED|nr:PepSY domain-containing protein [Pseudomonas schmalbachii]MBO3275153.1 PepSY domain-containing protein [Pseudomonas schmalbachii]